MPFGRGLSGDNKNFGRERKDMLPELFLERMENLLGEEYEAFLASLEEEKYQALRVNPLKKHANGMQADEMQWLPGLQETDINAVDAEGMVWQEKVALAFGLHQVPWVANGYYYDKSAHPGKHPYHEAGVYYIQEPSAMAPVTLLEVKPGQRVLDLCAAPGGKSTQIAGALQGDGLLVCNEIHPARAKILSENIERLGVRNACVTNETPQRLSEIFVEYFDAVLVDAPCSGEGMFRKNEDATLEWSPENVQICADRQDEILDCAARMLRPGGRLVYSTCTFAPAENEGSISRFVECHPEFRILPTDGVKEKMKQSMQQCPQDEGNADGVGAQDGSFESTPMYEKSINVCCDGRPRWTSAPAENIQDTLRLWPHQIKGEGHYAALLEKCGFWAETEPESDGEVSARRAHTIYAMSGLEKGINVKELGEFPEFVRENLKIDFPLDGVEASDQQRKGDKKKSDTKKTNLKKSDLKKEDAGIINSSLPGKYLKFGDNIYFAPEDMPGLKGMKVLRPGLHLGTLKKNRFEPSHALALALSPEDVLHVWHLSSESPEAAAYLNGQTFPAEGEKGWYLICVDGFSLGWGKLAGGIMKNHYPKGLRKN